MVPQGVPPTLCTLGWPPSSGAASHQTCSLTCSIPCGGGLCAWHSGGVPRNQWRKTTLQWTDAAFQPGRTRPPDAFTQGVPTPGDCILDVAFFATRQHAFMAAYYVGSILRKYRAFLAHSRASFQLFSGGFYFAPLLILVSGCLGLYGGSRPDAFCHTALTASLCMPPSA